VESTGLEIRTPSFASAESCVHGRSWFELEVGGRSCQNSLRIISQTFLGCCQRTLPLAPVLRRRNGSVLQPYLKHQKWRELYHWNRLVHPNQELPHCPLFLLSTPNGQSPRSIKSTTSGGSPLTPLQFMRRAEQESPGLRPMSPSKPPMLRARNMAHTTPNAPSRNTVWRP